MLLWDTDSCLTALQTCSTTLTRNYLDYSSTLTTLVRLCHPADSSGRFQGFPQRWWYFWCLSGLYPLKMSNIPIIKGISIGGTYAMDINQYAPARTGISHSPSPSNDRDLDGIQTVPLQDMLIETGYYISQTMPAKSSLRQTVCMIP